MRLYKKIFALVIGGLLFANSAVYAAVPFDDDEDYEEILPSEFEDYIDDTDWENDDFDEIDEPIQPPSEDDEGLEFLVYDKDGVMAFAIIAAHEKYMLRPFLARDQIRGRSTVTQMTAPVNDIAMINAGYFMPDGSLIGLTKMDGVIVGTDFNNYDRSAIGINSDGSTIFGRIQYDGSIDFYGDKLKIDGVNWERGENGVMLYNRYYAATTGTNNFGIEVVVRQNKIANIFHDKGNNRIPSDGYIISVHGKAAEFFKNAQVGDPIKLEENIISDVGDFNNAEHIIGAGPRLVMDGRVHVTATEERFLPDIRVGVAPRSAVGVTIYGDYIFAVVDGRQAHSKGCTLQAWADILLNEFGAFNAINLDGGGSTELVVKDRLVNSPSDGKERPVGSVLAILPRG